MTFRPTIWALLIAASLGLSACDGDGDGADAGAGNPASEVSVEEATAPLRGAPPELRAIRDEATELLGGGAEAFGERLGALRGTPVVVNKWASWCGPCRFEFPFFQAQAIEGGDEVAFLGVNSNDSEEAAATFLRELPLPYPSYSDPGQEIAKEFMDDAREFPSTAFYNSGGELAYVHLGGYADEEVLAAEIDRYAR
jgi:cytochrome c biogenesis protein CcmG/thiol:disulfide interchange protein DsbE